MKKIVVLIICIIVTLKIIAQDTEILRASQTAYIHKDPRLDILARKEAELNVLAAKIAARSAMGYRLQVLSTNDRELAMKTKTELLQKFPGQKVYMFYQLPYVKLRFGNFKSQEEAEPYKNQISRMLGGASIYYISERIEVKPEKEAKEDEDK